MDALPQRVRHHLTSSPPQRHLPPLSAIHDDIEQRSSQSPTATISPSQSPEPSTVHSARSRSIRSDSVTSSSNNNKSDSPSGLEGRLLPPLRPRSPPAATSPTTTIPPPLKRPRSPTHSYSLPATSSSFGQEPPRKMSRFANGPPSNADAWNHHHHMQDRVVLPPLSTAVDNGLTPSRRASLVASPSTYSSQGYAFTNTYDSQRPPTASSGMASPAMSTSNRMDVSMDQAPATSPTHPHSNHSTHPYRRPSLAGRSQSARTGPTSPLVQQDMAAPRLTSAYSDPNTGLSWNIPPPSAPESARPSTATYSAYGDYSSTDFSGSMATNGEGTPQSPSFAFASGGFTSAQQANMYGINRSAAGPHHHPGYSLAQAAAIASQPTPPPSNASSTTLMDQSQNHTPTPADEELAQLRTKVRELEFVNDLVQLRVVELENERAKLMGSGGSDKSSSSSSPKSTLMGGSPPPVDQDFQASWDKRTEARVKRFCSLNRAGNALCAWHDSRRERRAYPPRMAPPGTLNCGCTYEEALFEESLSRHKVGSYLPGEMVRMDPALRNPLLALLQWRYGYKDGDFERDPSSGTWVDGEGEHVWQTKASSGSGSGGSRRKQSDPDST